MILYIYFNIILCFPNNQKIISISSIQKLLFYVICHFWANSKILFCEKQIFIFFLYWNYIKNHVKMIIQHLINVQVNIDKLDLNSWPCLVTWITQFQSYVFIFRTKTIWLHMNINNHYIITVSVNKFTLSFFNHIH